MNDEVPRFKKVVHCITVEQANESNLTFYEKTKKTDFSPAKCEHFYYTVRRDLLITPAG